MLTQKDLSVLAPYLSEGDVVNIEIRKHGRKERDVVLEYSDGRKLVGNLDADKLFMRPLSGLTSISEHFARGHYGSSGWRGNCSGLLIKDILSFYKPDVFGDPAVGSGTSIDVANELGYGADRTFFNDLNPAYGGQNIASEDFDAPLMDFIFFHPPYYVFPGSSMPVYSGKGADGKGMWGDEIDPNDGSRISNPESFKCWFDNCNANLYRLLKKGGRMAILMGDSKFRGKYFSMFKEMNVFGTLEQVIIKKQYNCVSDFTKYSGKFIPIAHEYLVIIRKDSPYIVPITIVSHAERDIRTSKKTTWANIMAAFLEDSGGSMMRSDLIEKMSRHPKAESNQHIDAKMRQELQRHPKMFRCDGSKVILAVPA